MLPVRGSDTRVQLCMRRSPLSLCVSLTMFGRHGHQEIDRPTTYLTVKRFHFSFPYFIFCFFSHYLKCILAWIHQACSFDWIWIFHSKDFREHITNTTPLRLIAMFCRKTHLSGPCPRDQLEGLNVNDIFLAAHTPLLFFSSSCVWFMCFCSLT